MDREMMERLVRWKERESRKPLLLKGVRQVGKTFLLREFGKRFFRKTLYLNFEKDESQKEIFEKNLDPKRGLTEIALKFDEEIEIGHTLQTLYVCDPFCGTGRTLYICGVVIEWSR